MLTKNQKLQLRVQVYYDMGNSYLVYYYGTEFQLRQLIFDELGKSLNDIVKYSYIFTDGKHILKGVDKMWETQNKNHTIVVLIAKCWPDMTYRDQDQLVSCLDGTGYDKLKLFKFKYKHSKYLYYGTFQSLG